MEAPENSMHCSGCLKSAGLWGWLVWFCITEDQDHRRYLVTVWLDLLYRIVEHCVAPGALDSSLRLI